MSQFNKYYDLHSEGVDALSMYKIAIEDGIDQLTCIRMLREIFAISLVEAKKISFLGDTGKNIEDYDDNFTKEFTEIIDDELGLD